MGRFSEIDMLLKTLPVEREDTIYSTRTSENTNKISNLDQLSIWDFSDEELLCFISGKSISEVYSAVINRIITENKTKRPVVYQKNRG